LTEHGIAYSAQRPISEGFLSIEGLRPTASWERIGRYFGFSTIPNFGCWLGIEFRLWHTHGITPLWTVFSPTDWGKADKVRNILQPWCKRFGYHSLMVERQFAIGFPVTTGEEKQRVINSFADILKNMAEELSSLN